MAFEDHVFDDIRVEMEMDVFSLRFFDLHGNRLGSCQCVVTGLDSIRAKNLVMQGGEMDEHTFYSLLLIAYRKGYSRIDYERKKGTSFILKTVDLNNPRIKNKLQKIINKLKK